MAFVFRFGSVVAIHQTTNRALANAASLYGRVRFRSTEQTASVRDDFVSAKPFEEIPFKKGWPIVNNIPEFMMRPGKPHEIMWERHQMLGPIFREKQGPFDAVFITDVEALGDFLRQEGKYPKRVELPVWTQYRKDSGEADGVLTSQGENWQRMRSVIDKPILKIKALESYADEFNAVDVEFLERLARIRGSDGVVENIHEELFKWSLESVSTVLYQRRLGCLSDSQSPDTREFVKAVHAMFETTAVIAGLPTSFAKIVRPFAYRKHMKSWDTLFRVAKQYIDEAVVKLQSKPVSEDVSFLDYILSRETLTAKQVYANVTELMTAAVDTTSNTLQFVLYELAKNPDIQAKLVEELEREIPRGELPSPKQLRNMPYLKAVIKETLRLYAVGGMLGREAVEDVVVMGYRVPKGKQVVVSLFVMGRLPSLYDDPLTFRPERFMRQSRDDKPHPFANIPFGFGPRMCIGRRVAELEMQLLITQMLQRFRLKPTEGPPLELVQIVLSKPKDPVRVKLINRNI